MVRILPKSESRQLPRRFDKFNQGQFAFLVANTNLQTTKLKLFGSNAKNPANEDATCGVSPGSHII